MKSKELENKEIDELNELLKDTRIKLGKLKFELVSKSLKDSSRIGKTKKEIAQIMTAINVKRRIKSATP